MISSLIDCAQTGFARPLTHSEMEKLVNLYVQEGYAPETVHHPLCPSPDQ